MLRYVAMASAYAIAYVALRSVSFSHWSLLAGLRIGCLLLLPRRYWAALLVGEAVPLVYFNLQCLQQFGLAWTVAASVPPLLLAMPFVVWLRDALPGAQRATAQHMSGLLLCSFSASALTAVVDAWVYSFVPPSPTEIKVPLEEAASQYFLGTYLGILVLVPLLLCVFDALTQTKRETWLKLLSAHARVVGEAVALSLSMIVISISAIAAHSEFWLQLAQIVLFIPVVVFALRRGWSGAAFAGAVASCCIVWIMPEHSDRATLLAETAMALAMTTLLMLGARTTVMRRSLHEDWRNLRIARQELFLNELRIRRNIQDLDAVRAKLNLTHGQVMSRLRYCLPGDEELAYRSQLQVAEKDLDLVVGRLAPTEWDSMGHPNALWDGPIAQAVRSFGITYEVEPGGQMSLLAPDIRVALYRLACEMVTYVLTEAPSSRLVLRTYTKSERGIWSVDLDIEGAGSTMLPLGRASVLSSLGSAGLSEEDMRNRASLYKGSLLVNRSHPGFLRVHASLLDTSSDPAHDWVFGEAI
ncbi:MASE1 domain-containing protein [Dyella silvatica]|uniref:MASE1 domain-containing protein n=1 Tax=Dyella silvatica TaxID=2992128 RepID=UPI0022514225|nr:MASE1 domain-containing protein [Dyella silvatica]